MGLLDRLLGRGDARSRPATPAWGTPPSSPPTPSGAEPGPAGGAAATGGAGAGQDADRAAIARYRYLLRTAPPETIEQAHAEAFAQLTPQQRRQVLSDLSREVPESERARSADPEPLARMATRAELRRPGTLERAFGGFGTGGYGGYGRGGFGMGGMGMGGVLAGSLLASVAGAFVGTAIAEALIPDDLDLNPFDHDAPGQLDTATDPDHVGGFDAGGDQFADAGGGDITGSGVGEAGYSDVGDFGDDVGGDDFGGGFDDV